MLKVLGNGVGSTDNVGTIVGTGVGAGMGSLLGAGMRFIFAISLRRSHIA